MRVHYKDGKREFITEMGNESYHNYGDGKWEFICYRREGNRKAKCDFGGGGGNRKLNSKLKSKREMSPMTTYVQHSFFLKFLFV